MNTAKTINRSFKVGIMVTIGLVIFIGAIFIIGKQQNLFGSTFHVTTVFPSVSGLQVGNNVRLNGINIGTVYELSILNDSVVAVDMLIEESKRQFIRKNSKCLIGSEGLMGDKVISITPGSQDSETIDNNDTIPSIASVEIDEIIRKINNSAENAEIITSELAVLMYGINSGEGIIGKLIYDSTMADDISNVMDNLKGTSKSIEENMNAVQKSFLLRGAFRRMEKEKQENKTKNNNKSVK